MYWILVKQTNRLKACFYSFEEAVVEARGLGAGKVHVMFTQHKDCRYLAEHLEVLNAMIRNIPESANYIAETTQMLTDELILKSQVMRWV